jgi:sulfite dehydrogenase (quinone) subunit SoeC
MRPAFSVIFFTVCSGAGLGLFVALALIDASGWLGGFTYASLIGAISLAIAMVAAGLIASTFHLANRKNAWRAFTQWRYSWLSREGVAAVMFFVAALAYLASVMLEASSSLRVGALTTAIAMAWLVLFCTGMIYACLRTIPQWHTWLTPAAYLALGHYSGLLVLIPIAVSDHRPMLPLAATTLVLLALSAALKAIYFHKFAGVGVGPEVGHALGMTAARAKLLDAGHSHGTFLTHEFMFTLARGHARALRYASMIASFLVPLIALGAVALGSRLDSVALWTLVAVIGVGGLFLERWLFFAEARHVVRLYHGEPARY